MYRKGFLSTWNGESATDLKLQTIELKEKRESFPAFAICQSGGAHCIFARICESRNLSVSFFRIGLLFNFDN